MTHIAIFGYRRTAVLVIFSLALAILYYAFLLTIHKDYTNIFNLLAITSIRGLTFNSMLLHLLNGSFDVDPHTIGSEGFVHGGKTYTYFGIFPALLRIFFLSWPHFQATDFTRLSCLTATCLMASCKLMSVALIWRATATDRNLSLFIALVAALLFSGAQIQFLKPSIYQEAVLWSNAFASLFVYSLMLGIVCEQGFTTKILSVLAFSAGLCLMTRVPTAVGLYTAFGFLWLQLAWKAAVSRMTAHTHVATPTRGSRPRLIPLLFPVLILAIFTGFVGFINFKRWGNPFTFVDFSEWIINTDIFPEQMVRFKQYGAFNIIRIAYGFMYYVFPLWVIRDNSGNFLWSEFYHRALDGVELPPTSVIVSDPLLVGLAVYMLIHLIRYRDIDKSPFVVSTVVGLSIPAILMLTFMFMSPRYRMEYYPLLEFSAFIGFRHMISQQRKPPSCLFASAAIFGIVADHIFWFFFMISPNGDATELVKQMGWISFYQSMMPF